VSSDGKKFGKTAGNALWLDPKLTSPYTFFQFLRNLPDGDTEKMLNIFTDFPLNDIKKQCAHKNPNIPKEFMAFELTKKVHGEAAAKQARQASTQLFAIPEASSPAGEVPGAPTTVVSASELAAGLDILALVVKTHLCRSRGEARKLIQGNGLNMNGVQVTDPFYKIQQHDFQAPHETLLLRKGKKDYHLVKCEK
jgi:tyrosyl-tRNA synthetase